MSTRELVDKLHGGGKKLNESNPASQVYTSINTKTDLFFGHKVAGKLKWGLVEWKETGTKSMFDEEK